MNLSAPVGATISTSQGYGTIIDNDHPPAPTFSISDATATEGGSLTFTVTKVGATSSTLTVPYSTADNTAKAGSDYSATSGSLVFYPSDTTKTITVNTIDDSVLENPETMFVFLSGDLEYAKSSGIGTINDNDVGNKPPVTVNDTGSTKVCNAVWVNVVANDTDPEGNYPLTVTAVSTNGLGASRVSDASTVQFNAGSRTGSAALTYTVQDSLGASSTGTLIIQIGAGNDCK